MMNWRRWRTLAVTAGMAGLAWTLFASAQTRPDPSGSWVELTFKLPAIGNVDVVKEWTFGRIANLTRRGQDEFILEIRLGDGSSRRTICPSRPFVDLARVSNWMTGSGQSLSQKHYIERMVAFDADRSDRIIALVSLEPLPRNERKIARAVGGG